MTTALAPKTQLGKYQLVRHLASGGMADLWLARSTGLEGFERYVAIKRIRQEQARDQRFVQMFLDEARLAASLHHAHIATVHDIGQEKGEYFFTMEYVHGEDLRKILMLASAREQHLPIEHVMTIALAVASALHYAHEHKAQIVHRDVSPANVIVGYDGKIKVLDFGIAKAAHRTKDTQSGVLKGKVAYMSPEQCVGQRADRRSDIFSLGIVLYELVTVRRLFKAANDFLTMSSIIHGDIPWPSTIRPGIPRDLETIVMKALAPDREDRFQTAEEMRVALERFCAANHIRTSTTLLADYMRALFGVKAEPWLSDDDPALELGIDFDGTLPGVVRVPEAALKRSALPSTTPVQPGAPIMHARSKAITGPPPVGLTPPPTAVARTSSQPALATAVSPSFARDDNPFAKDDPSEAESGVEVEAPRPEGRLDVGDETLMVRPITAVTPSVVRQLSIVFAIAAVVAVIAIVLISRLRDDAVAPAPSARPDIRMPPPSTVPAAPDRVDPPAPAPEPPAPAPEPSVPPAADPAEVASDVGAPPATTPPDAPAVGRDPPEVTSEVAPDTAVKPSAGSAVPQVKLRDPPESKRKKKRRIKRGKPDAGPATEWDPTELFPDKK